MPRKVKTAFTGSDTDRALTGIHDIAFIARERDGVRGFEIRVGGGTSIMPRVAPTLVDFVTAEDGEYLKWAEAVFRIFDRQDWLRVNRARARIKVLVDKIGIEAMRELVEEELQGDWVAERDFSIDHRVFAVRRGGRRARRRRLAVGSPNGDGTEFARFVEANVEAPAPGGLLGRAGQGRRAATSRRSSSAASRRSCASTPAATRARPCTRTSSCAGCATRRVYDVWRRLVELGLGDAGADEVNDVVSCPGTDSCKLGITSSMGLNRAVQERIEAMGITDPLTRRIHIKMSGCPNGCSQHHIGNIGFYGASIKVGREHHPRLRRPHRRQLRGRRDRLRRAAQGPPARQAGAGGGRALAARLRGRARGGRGLQRLRRARRARRRSRTPCATSPCRWSSGWTTMNEFIDWNRKVPFVVQRGEGECAV